MNILVITQNPPNGCNYHRQILPLLYASKYGVSYDMYSTTDPEEEISKPQSPETKIKVGDVLDWSKYDFVFMIRYDYDGTIERAHSHGLKVLLDIDDYWHLHNTHNLFRLWKENGITQKVIDSITKADYITTTTNRLADHIKEYNENVSVVPNAMYMFDSFQACEINKVPDKKVRVGWVGSRHHVPDMLPMRYVFEKFWDTMHKEATIIFGGYNDKDPEIKDIHKILTANRHRNAIENYKGIWSMELDAYGQMYQHIDIALAPLIPTEFNQCKSELKIVEAGWFGIPVIASNIYPYNEVIIHGVNGFLCTTPNDWLKHIRYLVHNHKARYEMGQNIKQTILDKFHLRDATAKRLDIFKRLSKSTLQLHT